MYPHNPVTVSGVGGRGRSGVLVRGGGREVAAGVEAVPVAVPLVSVLLVHQAGPGRLEDVRVDIRPPDEEKVSQTALYFYNTYYLCSSSSRNIVTKVGVVLRLSIIISSTKHSPLVSFIPSSCFP